MGMQPHVSILYVLVAIAGATSIGSQIILYSFASQFYPTEIRSTGIGWSSGVGRIGGIIGPVFGGALLALNLNFNQNFILLAVPGLLAAIAVAFIQEKEKSKDLARVKPKVLKTAGNLIEK